MAWEGRCPRADPICLCARGWHMACVSGEGGAVMVGVQPKLGTGAGDTLVVGNGGASKVVEEED